LFAEELEKRKVRKKKTQSRRGERERITRFSRSLGAGRGGLLEEDEANDLRTKNLGSGEEERVTKICRSRREERCQKEILMSGPEEGGEGVD